MFSSGCGNFDDTIEAPIQKRAGRHQLDTLLRAQEYAEQLNRSHDRYHRLLDLLPEAVLLLRNGMGESVNEASIHLLDRKEPELIGNHPVRFVKEAGQQALVRYLQEPESGREQNGVRVDLATKDGSIPVEFRGVRLFEEGADAPLLQLLVRDLRNIEDPPEPR